MHPENPRWPLDVNAVSGFDKRQVKPPVQTT